VVDGGGGLFARLAAGADAPSRAVTLSQQSASVGDAITVFIQNGPAGVDQAKIRLSRNGTSLLLDAGYKPPGEGGAAGIATAELALPADLDAAENPTPSGQTDGAPAPQTSGRTRLAPGNYLVSVEFEEPRRTFAAARQLEIFPTGTREVHLTGFVPAWTDQSQTAYLEDAGEGKAKTGRATRVVSMELRGSGFQTGPLVQDNVVMINRLHERAVWSGCGKLALGTESAPVPAAIVGEVIDSERMRLCRVPVPGDGELHIQVGWGDRLSEPQNFRVYAMGRGSVAFIAGVVALVLALVPLALLGLLKGGYRIDRQKYRLRLLFLDPETDTYSLSKLQFYLWTNAALFSYAYFFVSRVWVQYGAWPDVPGTLPGIIAVAAGTSVGAQFISGARGSKGAGDVEPGFSDFITSGGVVAPDRLQMLLWTLFGVGAFFVAVLQQHPGTMAELPAIPEHLLYLMGLSSAGYLGGKLARKPGPVINEITVAPVDPDDAIARASTAAEAGMPDLSEAVADANSARSGIAAPKGAAADAAVGALGAALAAAAAARSGADFDRLIGLLGEQRSLAEKKAAEAATVYAQTTDAAAREAAASDAAVAQKAAAILQDLSADVTQAIAAAAAGAMRASGSAAPARRVITLRGTNLSAEAMLAIDGIEFPFHMLSGPNGEHLPEVLSREDNIPTFARVLRLTVDPGRLENADLERLKAWFGTGGTRTLTVTNPDGQKADVRFSLPPEVAQKQGAAT
jgi:hypothetical protein